MDCLMDIIKNWGGHIMSVLGILGGLWAYFRHDRKIKSQEKMLNDLQIKQMKKELAKEVLTLGLKDGSAAAGVEEGDVKACQAKLDELK